MDPQEIWEIYCGEKPVIDIGCGWFNVFEFEYIRFDKASQICGMKTCADHFGDFHNMHAFNDNTFAFINATDVIEHAIDPEKALREWLRILKIGGVLHVRWPGLDVWEFEKLLVMNQAVDEDDMPLYFSLGGVPNWIALDQNGKKFLDVHFHKISMDFVKKCLDTRVEILAEYPSSLIAKKIF